MRESSLGVVWGLYKGWCKPHVTATPTWWQAEILSVKSKPDSMGFFFQIHLWICKVIFLCPLPAVIYIYISNFLDCSPWATSASFCSFDYDILIMSIAATLPSFREHVEFYNIISSSPWHSEWTQVWNTWRVSSEHTGRLVHWKVLLKIRKINLQCLGVMRIKKKKKKKNQSVTDICFFLQWCY